MMPVIDVLNAGAGAVLEALLNSIVWTVAIAACAWAFLKLAPGVNAATRHIVWWTVLACVLIAPVVRFVATQKSAAAEPVSSEIVQSRTEAPPVEVTAAVTQPVEQTESPRVSTPYEWKAGYLPLYFVLAWLGAVAVQLARIAWSYRYLRAIKTESTSAPGYQTEFDEWVLACRVGRDVRLRVTDAIESPVAAGFRHPAVIIPRSMIATLTTGDLDHIVLHELAHLARRDDWTNLLARAASGLLAFHPVALWVLRRIELEREVACDDWVVTMTQAPRPYAATLARLVEFRVAQKQEMLATGIAGVRSHLATRIERLVNAASVFDCRTSTARVLVTVAAALALLAGSTQPPVWIAFAQDEAPLAPVTPAPPEPARAPANPEPPRDQPEAATPARPAAPPQAPAPHREFVHPPHPPVAPDSELGHEPPLPPAPPLTTQAIAQHPAPARAPAPSPAPPPPAFRIVMRGGSQPSFLRSLAAAGYSDLSVDEIIELKNHGVSAEYLAAMNQVGWGRLPIKQHIDLRSQGVSADYVKGLHGAGFTSLTIPEVITLRNHGVNAQTVRDIHALGFGPYGSKQMIEFSIHGARADFFRALKDAGFLQADPKDIMTALQNGVNARTLREAQQYGSKLTLRQIVRLQQAGVI